MLKIRMPYLHPEVRSLGFIPEGSVFSYLPQVWNRIVQMRNLRGLELEACSMKHWDPATASSLPNLRHLRLVGNIEFHKLSMLDRLNSLSLTNHPFTTYTSSDMRSLASLTNLQHLDLENVHFISWRDWEVLLSLTRLTCLRLPGRRKVSCVEELQLLISMLREAELKFPQKRRLAERENWVYLNTPLNTPSHTIL
jgi:hypothetical protein